MLWDGAAAPASRPLPQALPEMQTSEKGIPLRPGYYRGTLDAASSPLPRDPFLLSSAPPIPRDPPVPSAQSYTEGTPCPLSPAVPQRPQSTVPKWLCQCPGGTACLS